MAATRGVKRSRPLMTSQQFKAVAELAPNLTAEQIEAARLVMVEGRTLAWAGERFGWTRQSVGYHVKRLEALADSYEEARRIEGAGAASKRARRPAQTGLPPGWQSVTLAGPKTLVRQWEAQATAAAQALPSKRAKKNPANNGRV